MSKEYLEALEQIIEYITEDKKVKYKATILFDCKTIKKALERLEAIDNANPSEALKDLQIIENNIIYTLSDCDINDEVCQNLQYAKTKISAIEQYILKAQEQEKVLRVIKEKNVDTKLLRKCNSVDEYNAKIKKDYNSFYYKKYRLTQEEFDLLKRWANE